MKKNKSINKHIRFKNGCTFVFAILAITRIEPIFNPKEQLLIDKSFFLHVSKLIKVSHLHGKEKERDLQL